MKTSSGNAKLAMIDRRALLAGLVLLATLATSSLKQLASEAREHSAAGNCSTTTTTTTMQQFYLERPINKTTTTSTSQGAHNRRNNQQQRQQQQHVCESSSAAAALGSQWSNQLTNEQQKQQQQQQQQQLGGPRHQLPVLKSSFTPNDRAQLESCDNFFFNHEQLDRRHTVAELGLMALMSMIHATVYRDAYTQRYDTYRELKLARGPLVNQEQCLRHLEQLNERARQQNQLKYNSRDLNLYQLFDTYGRVSSGMLLGNGFFEGMYHECVRLRIKSTEGEQLPTRYCVASVKHIDWPQVDQFDLLNLKFAVCLPKSCDSMDYKNKFQLVQRLIEHQVRRPEEGQARLKHLYCLPDEESPLRSISQWPASWWTLVALASWLCVLVYATIQYERLINNQKVAAAGTQKSFGLTSGFAVPDAAERHPNVSCGGEDSAAEGQELRQRNLIKIYKLLSVTQNLKLLLDTTKESSLIANQQVTAPAADQVAPPSASSGTRPPVDLRCIEGIKVIAMCYVIMGHVLMCMTTVSMNGREFVSGSVAFWLANLVPAFAVNSFFTITGILTCYLMFKQNQAHTCLRSPAKWLAFIIYRYLRIMPMYALVVLYTKTLAKFAGSGPLWDYGTSSLGQRKGCELEPWWHTLAFAANFVPPLEHCIPSAWYLANDFQFFIITPLLLAALHWRPQLGERLLKLAALAGYLAGVHSIMASDVEDLRPIARFAPHGFKTYISHFSNNYTRPQYRIPAYLIGLLIGHKLFRYEKRAETAANSANSANASMARMTTTSDEASANANAPADWPHWFKRYAIAICLLLIGACCSTPFVGSRLGFSLWSARVAVALVANSFHIMFSSAVGMYILLATTGHGNQLLNGLLASPIWKPFARLSLCAVLVNVEVINYIVQSNANLHYITNQYQVGLNIIAILATYFVSLFVCLLFEAPIRGSLNILLQAAVGSLARKRKAAAIGATATTTTTRL